jgi:hypothetical protein
MAVAGGLLALNERKKDLTPVWLDIAIWVLGVGGLVMATLSFFASLP